ncbi:MAG: iron ABC transporter permease [Candidatus Omnitrophica bacterium]|nr:iron ABC transporter permease [Candidatus Omnitrophota bacterium]
MSFIPKPIIILCAILFIIIVLGPLLLILAETFTSMDNLAQVFLLNSRQISLFKNSMLVGVSTVCFALLLGVGYGFLISRTDIPLQKFFIFSGLIPLFMPAHITAIGWIKLLNICGFAGNIFFYSWIGVGFVLGLAYFPFIMLLTLTGLNSVDSKLEEAAALIHSKRHVIRKITLPLASAYIASGAILVFVFSLSNYAVPDMLRVNTYPVEIFVQFSAFYDTAKAVILALPLVAVCLLLVFVQRYLMANKSYISLKARNKQKMLFKLGKGKIAAGLFCALVFSLSMGLPMLILIIGAGNLATYAIAFKTAWPQIRNSLLFSFVSATFICLISFPLGYALARAGKKTRLFIDLCSMIPFAIPSAIFGVAMIRFWNRPSTTIIYHTFLVLVFGYTARFSAFAIRAISANISQIHRNLEESAELACQSWSKRLRFILLPLAWPGILASWVLCFALCMGELGVTLLVIPAGEATLPIRIYTLMHYGAHKLVCGLSVILVLIIMLPILIVYLLYNKYKHKLLSNGAI